MNENIKKYPFVVCDVFTEQAFGGNPLAVVTDAAGLSTEQMQNIAREFNYSETTFVLPAQRGGDYRVRIFTASTEFPFAGHPNIGTAIVLADMGLLPETGQFVFEELAGDVPVTLSQDESSHWRAELRAPELLSTGKVFSAQLIADVLSLSVTDISLSIHQPMEASVGLPFIVVELTHLAALQRAKINSTALDILVQEAESPFIHLYVRPEQNHTIRCRMFAPTDGVPEDPATGSANCALTALLTQLENEAEGEFDYQITQGVEMGRPSELSARVIKKLGQVTEVYIAGSAVMFSSGELLITGAQKS